MSDYTGPGPYFLIPRYVETQCVSVWGGTAANNTAIKLYRKDPQSDNLLWEIVNAGNDEYHLICYMTGTYVPLCRGSLTVPTADGSVAAVTSNTRSVKDKSTRWNIEAAKNGSGAYYFQSVVKPGDYLSVWGASSAEGSVIGTYAKEAATHFQFFIRAPTA